MRAQIGADFEARVGAARQSIGAGNAGKEKKSRDRVLLRRQDETARSGEIIKFRREDLADYGTRRPALQRLFHGPERRFGLRRVNEDEAIRIDPEKSEPRSIQIALFEGGEILADPDERRALSRRAQTSEGQRETCRGGMVAGPRRDDLVQAAWLESAREHAIESGMAERDASGRHLAGGIRRIIDPGDFLPQKVQPASQRLADRCRPGLRGGHESFPLFYICSPMDPWFLGGSQGASIRGVSANAAAGATGGAPGPAARPGPARSGAGSARRTSAADARQAGRPPVLSPSPRQIRSCR